MNSNEISASAFSDVVGRGIWIPDFGSSNPLRAVLNEKTRAVIHVTDLEIMQRAKLYVDQMANGVNPLTGQPIPEEDILNHVRISRCLFYVSDVLRQVIENGGKVSQPRKASSSRLPFSISTEQLAQFSFSDTPLKITQIVRQMNELSNSEDRKQLQPANITEFLLEKGFMELRDNGHGKQTRLPTEEGYAIGLSVEDRVAPTGQPIATVFYNRDAQQFIIDNMEAILAQMQGNSESEA